jgi:4-amino-4-deoxy-L-arabinose transferase-like glycosyltransferase
MRIAKLIENIKVGNKALLLVFISALLVRVWGIWYGLPLQINIDEPALVSTVLSLKRDLNPGHFDWPHLYFYMNGLFYGIFLAFRFILDLLLTLPESFYSVEAYFVVSRLLNALVGSFTVLAVYFLTKLIFNKQTALIAAFITAFIPVHVYESHFAKTDIAQTFFTAISLYFIYKVFLTNQRKYYIISGLFIGLTTSVKYGGVLLFFPLLLAFLLNIKKIKDIQFKQTIKNFFLSFAYINRSFLFDDTFCIVGL